jgi:hypothetical protein
MMGIPGDQFEKHTGPPHHLSTMPRAKSMIAHSIVRQQMVAPCQFGLRVPNDTLRLEHLVCPYCQVQMASSIGCERHIMLKRECRERRLKDVQVERRRLIELEYSKAGPSSLPAGPTIPLASPRRTPPPTPKGSGRTTDTKGKGRAPGSDGEWTGSGPSIEHFPISTAGAPISEDRTYPEDLALHMARCGNMANRGYFEGAEVLMTTGLTANGRNTLLQSSFVSDSE